MPTEEERAAQKARSERIRGQIDDLLSESEGAPQPAKDESPREFVERRMRDLAESESDNDEDS